MIAYNKTWLANLRLQDIAKEDKFKGSISDAEFKVIIEKYPVGFYTPGVFARVGIFILTSIVVGFADGLLSLLFATSLNIIETSGWSIFLALLSYLALEAIIKVKHHFRSGVDDALIFISGCLFSVGFGIMFTGIRTNYELFYLSLFLLSLCFVVRFANMLMSAICCASLLAAVFFAWTKNTPSGMSTIPFVMMLLSTGLYSLCKGFGKHKKLADYKSCNIVAQLVFALCIYAAGNYYIIQTLGDEIGGQTAKIGLFGTFFWLWTMTMPFVYLGWGILKKDAILLRTGLLLVAAAIVTFRHYYHVLPLDMALTVGGALLLTIAYAAMKYLKRPKYGFNYAEPLTGSMADHLKIESLIVAETFAKGPTVATGESTRFGGGDFGGGGSSSGY